MALRKMNFTNLIMRTENISPQLILLLRKHVTTNRIEKNQGNLIKINENMQKM